MSRLRKVQKAAEEAHRRSPRISAALEVHQGGEEEEGPAFRTRQQRGTNKRKLIRHSNPPNHVNVVQGPKHSLHQDFPTITHVSDQTSKLPSSAFLPEKRILQLVLDTLQRRDTYEIFAEPVDPNEVEDYYAIIKEPMDFGTMRAKLHEGMYKSLQQFEHDVFLIFNNAMHFNSSGTIYFRQARVINELAKKVFEVLRINPEKFELEFSETRRKVSRRNQGDLRESTNMNSSDKTISETCKIMPISSRGTLNRKSTRTNHGCSDIAKHVGATDVEVPKDTKDRSRCGSFKVDKRRTYRPLSLDEDETIFSTAHRKLKLLEHVSQQDISYRDSLMLFVKDLGPTAINIAKRKLLGCEIRTASSSVQWRLPDTTTFKNTVVASRFDMNWPCFSYHSNSNDLRRGPREKFDLEIASGGEKILLDGGRVKGPSPLLEGTTQGQGWSFGCDNSRACAEDLNGGSRECRMMLLNKDKVKLLVNREDQLSGSNFMESSDVSSCSTQAADESQMQQQVSSSSKQVVLGSGDHGNFDCPTTNEIRCSSKALKISKPADQIAAPSSSFVFNLPYLKHNMIR